MIKDGFMYIAVLIFLAAILVNLPRIFKGRIAQNIFSFAPPVVLIYMGNDAFMHDENVESGGNSRGVQYTQKPGSLCNVVFNAAAV